jgi:hypothetical protein
VDEVQKKRPPMFIEDPPLSPPKSPIERKGVSIQKPEIIWIWPRACDKCFGNLVWNKPQKKCVCEDCGNTKTYKYANDERKIALRMEEWGPKNLRLELTEAGKCIVDALNQDSEPSGDSLLDLMKSYRGLLSDQDKIRKLREGGFIL